MVIADLVAIEKVKISLLRLREMDLRDRICFFVNGYVDTLEEKMLLFKHTNEDSLTEEQRNIVSTTMELLDATVLQILNDDLAQDEYCSSCEENEKDFLDDDEDEENEEIISGVDESSDSDSDGVVSDDDYLAE